MSLASRTEKIALQPYLHLIGGFVSRRLSGEEFESIFYAIFKNDPTLWSRGPEGFLEAVFQAAESFNPYGTGVSDGLNEEAFRERVADVTRIHGAVVGL
jgi:hypothetical protein